MWCVSFNLGFAEPSDVSSPSPIFGQKGVWLDRGFNYTPQSAPNGSVTQGVSASKPTTKGPPLPRQTQILLGVA